MSSNHDTPASREASNRPPDGPAVGPDGDTTGRSNRLGRRTFIKGIGATAAAGLGTKYVGSPVGDAEAVAPLLVAGAIGVTAGAVAGLAFGAEFAGPDEEQVADSITWNSYVNEYTRAREDNLMVEELVASLTRDIQLVENKAREEAIFRIYEQGVDSGTEAEATTAAENAIDAAYATVERSILTSWNLRANRADSFLTNFTSWESNPNGSLQDTNYLSLDQSNPDRSGSTSTGSTTADLTDWGTTTHTLLDGGTLSVAYNYNDDSTYSVILNLDPTRDPSSLDNRDGYGDTVIVPKPDPADFSTVDEPLDVSYDQVAVINSWTWRKLLGQLYSAHSTMKGEVSSMVSTYYQPAVDGEIDLVEAVGPEHLTNTALTATDYQEAAMALRGMGYPMSKQVVTISVPTEDGESMELTGRLSWTAHQGNTLAVGQTHFAENIPGSIFAAVNLPEGVTSLYENETNTTEYSDVEGPGAEIIELTDEFDIVSAEGADGVSFEDRSLASSDLTNEEINQIYKENYTANKEATETVHETATGGGGGAFGLTNTQLGAGLVAAAVALGIISN